MHVFILVFGVCPRFIYVFGGAAGLLTFATYQISRFACTSSSQARDVFGVCLRFIYVFGGAGLFTFATAVAGLVGSSNNSRVWLAVYAFMAVLLLLAQVCYELAWFLNTSRVWLTVYSFMVVLPSLPRCGLAYLVRLI